MMDLVWLVLGLSLVGFALWFIQQKIPMDPYIKILIQVVIVVAVIYFFIKKFGGDVPNVLN